MYLQAYVVSNINKSLFSNSMTPNVNTVKACETIVGLLLHMLKAKAQSSLHMPSQEAAMANGSCDIWCH